MAEPARDGSPITIDYVADLACPWCYIGLRRWAKACAMRPERPIKARWRPFMLNPSLPAEGMDRAAYVRAKFGNEATAARIYQRVAETGAADGIAFDFARMRRAPNTLRAHRLILWAQERSSADTLIERLFRALFVDGKDVGDVGVLAEEAVAAGLDPNEIEAWLLGDELADEVLRSHEAARRQGIRGVPVFVLGGDNAISGAQPPEVLAGLIDIAAAEAERS